MTGPLHRTLVGVLFALVMMGLAGCARPLGIVRQASEGAEALTTRAEDTFKGVHDKVDAFGDRLKAKAKDLGEDLTTWKDNDGAAITPTSAVRIDPGPTVR